jgi:phenylpropionate dioxygenase-like ring-hydroxylating dioxygenase large terminal subunit
MQAPGAFADMTALRECWHWVSGDELVCPYHGWRYRADGSCAAIPQLEDPARVPRKARIGAFGCQERYGLIWVALAEPRWAATSEPASPAGSVR